jgi:cell division transport system ATP-binding protein
MNPDDMIKIQGGNFYQNQTRILSSVDFDLKKGAFAYLIGKTGSGKSTFLKTLYAALPFTEGAGKVAGFDLTKINRNNVHLLRRSLGIIFQDFNLLEDRTVFENLHFVLKSTGWKDKKKMQLRIAEVLEEVGLGGMAGKMPNTLSGGEKQRVVIARAIINAPQIILADEPTGNLDPETALEILDLLMRLNQTKKSAVVLATHNMNMIERFPHEIYECTNGLMVQR